MKHWAYRAIALCALVIAGFTVVSTPAEAATHTVVTASPIGVPACAVGGDPDKCLPIDRWMDASQSFTSNIDFPGGTNIGQSITNIPYVIMSNFGNPIAMTFGNAGWRLIDMFASASTGSGSIEGVTQLADQITVTIGDILVKGVIVGPQSTNGFGLGIILFLVPLIRFVVGKARGRSTSATSIVKAAALFAIMAILWSGATATATLQKNFPASPYQPQTGAPSWIVGKATDGIAVVSSVIATNVANPMSQRFGTTSPAPGVLAANVDPLGCQAYIDGNIRNWMTWRENPDAETTAKTKVLSDSASESAQKDAQQEAFEGSKQSGARAMINYQWVNTGYMAFSAAQYGSATTIGQDYVACRQLDDQAKVQPGEQAAATTAAAQKMITDSSLTSTPIKAAGTAAAAVLGQKDKGTGKTSSLLFGLSNNPRHLQAKITAWSMCRYGETVSPLGFGQAEMDAFTKPNAENMPLNMNSVDTMKTACETAANATPIQITSDKDNGIDKCPFCVYPGTDEFGVKFNDTDKLRNFQSSIRGYDAMTNYAGLVGYNLGSTGSTAGFGTLFGALFIFGMIAAVIFGFCILTLAYDMFTNKKTTRKYIGSGFGFLCISAFTSLIVLVVALISNQIYGLGETITGGSQFSLNLWAGMAPLITIVLLHFIIKKLTKFTSPFTPQGAAGYVGAAAGGALGGAAIGSMIGQAGRRTGMADIGKKGMGALKNSWGKKPDETGTPSTNDAGVGNKNTGGAAPEYGTKNTTPETTPQTPMSATPPNETSHAANPPTVGAGAATMDATHSATSHAASHAAPHETPHETPVVAGIGETPDVAGGVAYGEVDPEENFGKQQTLFDMEDSAENAAPTPIGDTAATATGATLAMTAAEKSVFKEVRGEQRAQKRQQRVDKTRTAFAHAIHSARTKPANFAAQTSERLKKISTGVSGFAAMSPADRKNALATAAASVKMSARDTTRRVTATAKVKTRAAASASWNATRNGARNSVPRIANMSAKTGEYFRGKEIMNADGTVSRETSRAAVHAKEALRKSPKYVALTAATVATGGAAGFAYAGYKGTKMAVKHIPATARIAQKGAVAVSSAAENKRQQRNADIAAMRETHAARIAAREDADQRTRELRETAMQRATTEKEQQREQLGVARAEASRRMAEAAAASKAAKTAERAAARQRAAQARIERNNQRAEQKQRERDFNERFTALSQPEKPATRLDTGTTES